MRVDFYQLAGGGAQAIVPLLARNTLKAGERLLVVSDDEGQLARIGDALWKYGPEGFLANGRADEAHAARQPILLSGEADPVNGARYLAISDGRWRDAAREFVRTFFLFDEETLQAARACWRDLGRREGLDRHFWKQQGRKWVEAG